MNTMLTKLNLTSLLFTALLAGTVACGGQEGDEAYEQEQSEDALRRGGFAADGDACTVRTGVPGTEKGLECCSTADTSDCTVILKPFPSLSARR